MDISYNRLLKLLIDKNLNKTKFGKAIDNSQNTLMNFQKINMGLWKLFQRFLDF